MKEEPHPFQPGVEVAVMSAYDDGRFTKTKVAKIYKNGNFVLEAENYKTQQWKASSRKWSVEDEIWEANPTTRDHWSRYKPTVRLWDARLIAELKKAQAKTRLLKRARTAVSRVRDFHTESMTEWQIEALEYAVKLYEGCPIAVKADPTKDQGHVV